MKCTSYDIWKKKWCLYNFLHNICTILQALFGKKYNCSSAFSENRKVHNFFFYFVKWTKQWYISRKIAGNVRRWKSCNLRLQMEINIISEWFGDVQFWGKIVELALENLHMTNERSCNRTKMYNFNFTGSWFANDITIK